MPATIIPFTSATSLFEPAEKRNRAPTVRRTRSIRVSALDECDAQLWRVSARQSSLGETIAELLVLAVFILSALALIAGCFAELQPLLQTDAIGHVAIKALQLKGQ
jgi:hypothetical protein